MDGGAWWAAVPGVAKSRTRLSDFTFMMLKRSLQKSSSSLLTEEGMVLTKLISCHLVEDLFQVHPGWSRKDPVNPG